MEPMDNIIPFNPLDKRNLGASVAEAMLRRPVCPLGDVPDFIGVGVYAIYYTGPYAAYKAISSRNQDDRFAAPIYIGKAVPQGARKGGGSGESNSRALCNRVRQHAASILAAQEYSAQQPAANRLEIKDFHCRFLVVDDIWIPLGESLLIARFVPVWNSLIDGFGNHDPGAGRREGARPRWDVLHPGRDWAFKCKDREETAETICSEIESYLRTAPFPESDQFIRPDGSGR